MNPAETLREAARIIRETAQHATPGPWHIAFSRVYPRWVIATPEGRESERWATDVIKVSSKEITTVAAIADADLNWIALANPAIAAPLADLLDAMAAVYDAEGGDQVAAAGLYQKLVVSALEIARVIAGVDR